MSQKSANLDLLRAIAVTFVVVSHLPFAMESRPAWYQQNVLGRFGIAMFFVHTVLVLMQSLEARGETAGQFLLRRAFRIYPLSIAVVLITAGLMALGNRALDSQTFISNLLLIQNITGASSFPTPLWTLPYEVQMYLTLPLLYGITRTTRPVLKAALLWCAGVLLATLSELLIYLPCFLPGVLAFTLRHREKKLSPWVLIGVVAFGVVSAVALVTLGVPREPVFWVLCLTLGIVIPHCREITSKGVAAVASVVATYSYGIYLTHAYALYLAFRSHSGGTLSEWTAFAVALPSLAVLAYHAIEKPGIKLGAALAKRLAETKKAPPAEAGGARAA
jgi:peptidoglycan/LPS O-acetylase OafA/YrhL